MKNSDMPAKPLPDTEGTNQFEDEWRGLTKREHFAAMMMQGFIAADGGGMPDADTLASYSIEYANALLAALDADN